jgi:hypothetical protein
MGESARILARRRSRLITLHPRATVAHTETPWIASPADSTWRTATMLDCSARASEHRLIHRARDRPPSSNDFRLSQIPSIIEGRLSTKGSANLPRLRHTWRRRHKCTVAGKSATERPRSPSDRRCWHRILSSVDCPVIPVHTGCCEFAGCANGKSISAISPAAPAPSQGNSCDARRAHSAPDFECGRSCGRSAYPSAAGRGHWVSGGRDSQSAPLGPVRVSGPLLSHGVFLRPNAGRME